MLTSIRYHYSIIALESRFASASLNDYDWNVMSVRKSDKKVTCVKLSQIEPNLFSSTKCRLIGPSGGIDQV